MHSVRQIAALVLTLLVFSLASIAQRAAQAGEAGAQLSNTVWTAIIPEGFPGYVYTWKLNSDGTYLEDGQNAETGASIQQTLSGRWSVEDGRMILRQDTIGYVFDGVIIGKSYSGTLYLGDKKVSQFCATQGGEAPDKCKPDRVASLVVH